MDKTNLQAELNLRMTGSMKILDNELKGLRTGRASVNLLDSVIVEAYGNKAPLAQVATISTPDARTIMVQVWDKSMVKAVEKAIIDRNLGVHPTSDGTLVRMTLPPLTAERRKDLVKLAYKYGENTKILLRNVRRDGNDSLKKLEKDKIITSDQQHLFSAEIQKLTDEFISKVEERLKQKEQDILTI